MNDGPSELVVAMIVVALSVVVINDWQKRRLAERAWESGEKPKRKYLNHRTDWGLVVLLTVVTIGGALIESPWHTFSPEFRETLMEWGAWLHSIGKIGLWVAVVVALIVSLIGGLIVVSLLVLARFFVVRDSDLTQIKELAFKGDIETALDLTHQVLDGPGKQVGTPKHLAALFHLAALEGMRGNWQETLLLIEQVERFAASPILLDEIRSLTYWQLGRLEEAEHGFREILRRNPYDAVGLAALGLFLFDTDRPEESLTVLKSLECVIAGRMFTSRRAFHLLEHLRQVTNARRHLAPDVPLAESELAMRRMLLASMDHVGFRGLGMPEIGP